MVALQNGSNKYLLFFRMEYLPKAQLTSAAAECVPSEALPQISLTFSRVYHAEVTSRSRQLPCNNALTKADIELTGSARICDILLSMNIAELEESEDWQATAEDTNQHQVVIMRTHQSKYHLHDMTRKAAAYAARVQFPEGRPTYSADEVKAMFASAKLKLLKGSIPA